MKSACAVALVGVVAAHAGSVPTRAKGERPPADRTSTVTADFGTIRRVVPPFLFGQNLQTIERGEGLLAADATFDSGIMALLDEARVTTLRYPGGTAADYFHWWQAVGPQSRRPPQSTGYVDEYYRPVVGPEEFLRAAIALRANPFVTANSGTGSAAEAKALAQYFNSRGFPVVFWEVGNEIYFEGIDNNGRIGLPPNVYAEKIIEYAAAIREEAPYARVFAAGVIGPEETDSYWNAVVLGLAGPYVDGLSVHNAYFPLYGYLPDGTVPSDEYLFTAMLGATAAVERSTAVLSQQLQRLGRQIPIFVTEYDGIFFPDPDIEPPARTFERNPTLGCALYNASVLHILMRNDDVHGAHHMSLAGARFGSLVGIDGAVRFRNPQFYVHREYAREGGHLLVKSTLDARDAVFSSGPIKLLAGQRDVPMLDTVATRDDAGNSYALFVVNRSLSESVQTQVLMSGLPATVTGTVSVLDGPSYTSRNDAQAPERVALTTEPFGLRDGFTYVFPPHSLTIFRWSR